MVSKETEQKISQLQLMEQNAQQLMAQKQQFQAQLIEIESALKELKTTKESYKIIGNIMVKTGKEQLQKDLNSKKEMFELRIKTLEKQENKLKEKAKEIQSEVLKNMKNDGKD